MNREGTISMWDTNSSSGTPLQFSYRSLDPLPTPCNKRKLGELPVTPPESFDDVVPLGVPPACIDEYRYDEAFASKLPRLGATVLKNDVETKNTWTISPWSQGDELKVNEPFHYLMSQPGKDFRKKLLAACNVWLQIDDTYLEVINKAISMLHNASLLIDDIQDGSEYRRGAPVAHNIYGIARTINSANYIYFQAQQELFSLPNCKLANRIFNEELLALHRGQGMDLLWRDTLTIPTESEYIQMVSNKTGGLFRLAIRLMMSCSKEEEDLNLIPLAEVLGLIFQIQDDCKNLTSKQMSMAKGFCDDLTEGKFSFPIIHAIRHSASSADNRVLNVLKLRTKDHVLKAHVVEYMQVVTNSFQYTKERLQDQHATAQQILEGLGENREMEAILKALAVD